jgi:hypothetical protein
MTDFLHLIALQARLVHESERLAADPANKLRQVWVRGIEREIADEKRFLGLDDDQPEMSDEELLAELTR